MSNLNQKIMKELTEKECMEMNGGYVQFVIAVASAAIYLYNNWDDFAEGFNEGYNSTRR